MDTGDIDAMLRQEPRLGLTQLLLLQEKSMKYSERYGCTRGHGIALPPCQEMSLGRFQPIRMVGKVSRVLES